MMITNRRKKKQTNKGLLRRLTWLLAFCSACTVVSLAAPSATAGKISTGNELLFQRNLSVNRSVNIFDTDTFDLDLRFGDQFFTPTNPISLFDNLSITPEDVGSTFEATVDNDDAFLMVLERLTDLQNDFITVLFTEAQPEGLQEQRGWSEAFFFLNSPTSFSGISSSAIRSITLTVDQFNLVPAGVTTSPFSPPVDLMLTLNIFGGPEPTTVWLLMAGLITLSRVRRR